MTPRKPAAAPSTGGSVGFGEDGFYSGGGFDLPPGEYAVEHTVQMYQPHDKDGRPKGEAFLAMVLSLHPLGGGDVIEKVLSMGGKSALSFMPTADGKGLEPVAGAKSGTLNESSNWAIYRKSLRDCGLPEGIFTNDVSALDGIWVRTDNEDEPENRKSFGARTGEAEQQKRRPGKVPVVVEILDGGKPWEGTGGFDFETKADTPAPKTAGPRAVPAKPAPKKAAPAPVVEEEPAEEATSADEDVLQAAAAGCESVLSQEKNANGCTKITLRTGAFSHIKKSYGGDMAQAVQNLFATDAGLNSALSPLGYIVKGGTIIPQQ